MESRIFVFLAVYMLPCVYSLECYDCSNSPGLDGTSCDASTIPVRECGFGFDRCMTIKGTYEFPLLVPKTEITTRNCSSSLICDGSPFFNFTLCGLFNATGWATECEAKCCDENTCDPFNPSDSTDSSDSSGTHHEITRAWPILAAFLAILCVFVNQK